MKRTSGTPKEKFNRAAATTPYRFLSSEGKDLIGQICTQYYLSYQEIREFITAARDCEMWGESFPELWRECGGFKNTLNSGVNKEKVIGLLRDKLSILRKNPTRYLGGTPSIKRNRFQMMEESSDRKIFGKCPVASPKTVCCNLKTIDVVQNCGFGCSYCTIQTFYGDRIVFDKDLDRKLSEIKLDPDRFYHIGTGQSSDSLMWGNRGGMLESLCGFAAANPNVLLEFKTKSANAAYFLKNRPPKNVVLSWSLNTDTVIKNEEHFTAGLKERLAAAQNAAESGIKVAFHFHPLVYYEGWDLEYSKLIGDVIKRFSSDDVLFVSFGTLTFIKPVVSNIRKRSLNTKVLQMEMVKDPHGKLTYPDDIKIKLFNTAYNAFTPWHKEVFFYLCMEREYFWREVFGWCYGSNAEFERDFGLRTLGKIKRSNGAG